MKWSFSVGRVANIDVRVHATFFLLVAWVAWSEYAAQGSMHAALHGVLLIGLLFAIVVLHELGHALTARRFGVATRDITLLPIGGIARMERMPKEPRQELLVAIAGPAVNVVLALVLGLVLLASGIPLVTDVSDMNLLSQLLWLNISLAVFNMIPAFPMDGGRALRATLAMRMESVRATELAARLGKTVAFVFGVLGLFASPVLVLIALFVWLGAEAELGAARFRSALRGLRVEAAAIREFHVVGPRDRLELPVSHAVAGFQHDFPVLDRGEVVGALSHRALLRGVAERGLDARVAEVMEAAPEIVGPEEGLVDAVERLERAPSNSLHVMTGGRLIGVLTMHSVGELLAVREALAGSRPRLFSGHSLGEQPEA